MMVPTVSLYRLLHQDNAALLALYFCLNTALTLMNKLVALESKHHISCLLGATHAAATWLGCILYERFRTSYSISGENVSSPHNTRASLTGNQTLKLFFFALLYTANISLSNYSTRLASLPMWQSIRATGPLLTVLILFIWEGPSSVPQQRTTYISLLAVVSGVIISVHGERWDITLAKLTWTFFGALAAVVKSYVQHRLPKYGLHLRSNELLQAILPYTILQHLAAAYATGELTLLAGPQNISSRFMTVFALSAMTAFFLNLVSFRAFSRVPPMSIAVAANLKQVVILFLPFQVRLITEQVVVGTLITVLATIWYSLLQERQKKVVAHINVIGSSEMAEAGRHGPWQNARKIFRV